MDNAIPIIINGVHYGNFFIGQFFLEQPDLDFFRAQAKKCGFDENSYLEAVKKVPIWTQEQLNDYVLFIKELINVISVLGLKTLKESIKEREKLIKELQNALDNVNTLEGLIPICSNCKKIRDDKGFWNQVEAYIMEHSSATFTHSVCPECGEKLY